MAPWRNGRRRGLKIRCLQRRAGSSPAGATTEEARGTARDNALFNAQSFRQENVEYIDWSVEARADSTQANNCPQDDGWATMKFVSPDHSHIVNVKCFTVSSNIQCIPETEFKAKPFAADDGHCQPPSKVPFPLPKIAK